MSDLKKLVDDERKKCEEQVRSWRAKLDESQTQLKYWEMQLEAIRTISTRLMLNGWKEKE